MVRDSVTDAVCAVVPESVTWNLSELPLAVAEGVPASAPVEASSEIPEGSDPEINDHLYGVVPPLAASVAAYALPTVPAGRLLVVMSRGVGDVGFEGDEDEFPDGGGSVACPLVPVELPPQPAAASAMSAIGASHSVVAFPCRIVLAPIRGRLRRSRIGTSISCSQAAQR